jgi:hypothetical protein
MWISYRIAATPTGDRARETSARSAGPADRRKTLMGHALALVVRVS